MVSVLLYCAGLLLLIFARNPVMLPVAIVVFICGEVLMTPCFDETAKPLHEPVERDDVVAVIPQRRRGDGKSQLTGPGEEINSIVMDFRCERRAFGGKVRHQATKRRRIENRAR